MTRFLKTPYQKLETKINNIVGDGVTDHNGEIKVDGRVLLTYNEEFVSYTKWRYYPRQIESLAELDFKVTIVLDHDTLKFITTGSPNPPNSAKIVIQLFNSVLTGSITELVIGAGHSNIVEGVLSMTTELYETFLQINTEEGRDRTRRFKDRLRPFFEEFFNIELDSQSESRDYGLLLREVLASGQVNQEDIISLTAELESGNSAEVVIKEQVSKQAQWLISTIEELLEIEELNKRKAKDFGNDKFGFLKISVTGPEHLMELILSKYGQFTLFGVPALLNTDKYVAHSGGLSNSQFDIILINHQGEVELVELKRPDKYLLSYDSSRAKFYPSKDLSVGVSQSERYITTVMKDNDDDYKIDNLKVRDYLNRELGSNFYRETVRPVALIIMGSYKTVYKAYDDLSDTVKSKVNRDDYTENGDRAYRELKGAFKNINIMTYSELLEVARTRLQIFREEEE